MCMHIALQQSLSICLRVVLFYVLPWRRCHLTPNKLQFGRRHAVAIQLQISYVPKTLQAHMYAAMQFLLCSCVCMCTLYVCWRVEQIEN